MFALLEQALDFEAAGDVAGGLAGRRGAARSDQARRHGGGAILEPAIGEEAVGPHPVSVGRLAGDVAGDAVEDGLERDVTVTMQPVQLGEGDPALDPMRVGLLELLPKIDRPRAGRVERVL
ncbi:hypothetical protein [Methylobacterium goesingense]|uniref:Uncharacterized protein n=1 Tax=Methylobacterium goesingense TaxID=243690 RepID=A0ABV2L1J1_9HYPH|nr:hypothetical protein [Methylobacterium goesingense]